jgi:hypothetical protein
MEVLHHEYPSLAACAPPEMVGKRIEDPSESSVVRESTSSGDQAQLMDYSLEAVGLACPVPTPSLRPSACQSRFAAQKSSLSPFDRPGLSQPVLVPAQRGEAGQHAL